MRKLAASFLLLLCVAGASAQAIDSLKKVVASSPEDTNRVMAMHHLFRAYLNADKQPEMLEIAENGLFLAQKLKFEKGIEHFLFNKATIFDIQGNSLEAIPIFEEGLKIAQGMGQQTTVANYYLNLGVTYYGLGELDKALQNYLSAYHIFKALNLQKKLAKVLNNIGIIYRTQGKRDQAEAIYKESIAIKESLRDTLGMAASYQNLAAVVSASDREMESIDYLNKALEIYEKYGLANDAAGCYATLGLIYLNFDQPEAAQKVALKAKLHYDRYPSAAQSSSVYSILGHIAFLEKNYAQSETYLLESAKWARQFNQQARLWDILNELAKTQFELGKHEAAYHSLRESYAIRDTVTEQSRLELMEEMQTKFEVAKKDSELKINQLDLKQRTLERNWLLAGAAILGFLTLVIFFGLRSRIRANKKIAAQQYALQQQHIVQLEQASKLTTLSAMIEGQEQERSRIAADLHDGLGGLLTSVKSHFNSLEKPSLGSDLFDKTNRLLDDACGEVRRISHNMMPRALALAGLSGAIEDLAQDLDKQGIKCQLEIIGLTNQSLSTTQTVTIYRIIQELTNNVVKHAQADQILLQLIRHDGTLTIILEDNGKGFDLQKARQQKGLGLSNIESRVKFLRGHIEWDSVPGEGTVVSIQLFD
jgi:signal transduction histidine kinase